MPGIYEDYINQFELIKEWIDAAMFVLQIPGEPAPEHNSYWQQWKAFLEDIQRQPGVLEQHVRASEKTPRNRTLLRSLEVGVSDYLEKITTKVNELLEIAYTLKPPLAPMQLNQINGQWDEWLLISTRDSGFLKRHQARCKTFEDQLVTLRDALPLPESLRIFIWHSQRNATDIDQPRVRRLAGYLKTAGFDVKLDIVDNDTGSVPAYSAYIDGPNKTEVILVICTPDVPTLPKDTALSYELGRVECRYMAESSKTRRIFPVILRGDHEKSVPGFLKQHATGALNVSNSATYVHAFFELIRAIYLKDANVIEQTMLAYDTYVKQVGHQPYELPELEESLPDTSHIAASSSQHCPAARADSVQTGHLPHVSPELEEDPFDASHMAASSSQRNPPPGSSKTTPTSSSGFFHHPEPTGIPALPSDDQKLPFGQWVVR